MKIDNVSNNSRKLGTLFETETVRYLKHSRQLLR